MLLHHDKELFREVIFSAAADFNLPIPIIEKDYYVTVILKKLAELAPMCVFKGGTSLSKCHHAINRFSEDIDIAFCEPLTQGQRKNLKNKIIAGISEELGLSIVDWENARSRRDYNCYTFAYTPLEGFIPESLIQGVKMEVSLGSISFPTIKLPVDSYVYQYLSKENMDIVDEYELHPFDMNLQSLERTFIDKVFAVCDYYMTGNVKRNSRHLYDIYMLMPWINMNEELKDLIHQIRDIRSQMEICPSAKEGVNVSELLKEIISKKVYVEDYVSITSYFQNYPLPYEETIKVLEQIAKSDLFNK